MSGSTVGEEVARRIAQWQQAAAEVGARLATPGKIPAAELARTSGIDFLRRIGRGELPGIPIGATMGFLPVEIEHGRVVFQGTPDAKYYNPIGSVHGGYIATLLDSAVGCAVHTMLEQGFGYTTLELKVNYVRAVTDGVGPVRAEGKVINLSRRVGIAEGRLYDVQGKLYAHATTTCLVFPLPSAGEVVEPTQSP